MAGRLGARVALPAGSPTAVAFGEDQGRYLVTLKAGTALPACPVPLVRLGTVGGSAVAVDGHGAQQVDALRLAHEAFLPGLMTR